MHTVIEKLREKRSTKRNRETEKTEKLLLMANSFYHRGSL